MGQHYKEFAAKIKTKYPSYANMDDLELAKKVVSKYPIYESQVTFDNEPAPGSNEWAAQNSLAPFLGGALDKEQLPADAASTAMGMATVGMAARKAVPLVGLAAAGGEGLKQVYEQGQEHLGFPRIFNEKAPDTSQEAAKRLFWQGLVGSSSEALGRGASRLFTPFASGTTPAVKSGIEAAKSEGINVPLSARTESRFPQFLERFGETSPFGTGITLQKKEAQDAFRNFTDRLGSQIGEARSPEVAASLVKESILGYDEALHAAKDEIYDKVLPGISNLKPKLDETTKTLEEIIRRRGGTAEPEGLDKLRGWLKELKGKEASSKVVDKGIPSMLISPKVQEIPGEPGTINTVSALRNFRTNIGPKGKFNDPAVSGLQSDLNDLYGAVTRDMDATVKGVNKEAYVQLKQVDELYHQGMVTMKDKLFKSLIDAKPEALPGILFQPNSASTTKLGKEIIGEDAFNDMKRQWFDGLIKKSTILKEGTETLSPQKLSSNLRKMGNTIEAMFDDPKQYEKIKKLEQISDLLSRGKEITGGSQTAFLMPTIKGLANVLNSPLVKSEFGKRLLSEGLPGVGSVVKKVAQPAFEVAGQGTLKMFKNNENQ